MKTYISIHDVNVTGVLVAEVAASTKHKAIREFREKYSHLICDDELFATDFFVRKCDAMYRIDCYVNGDKKETKYCLNMLHAMTISLWRATTLRDAYSSADDAITNEDFCSNYELRVSADHTRFEVVKDRVEVLYSFEVRKEE